MTDKIEAAFEITGEVAMVLACVVATILSAPFMVLGWLMYRAGWVK